MSKLAANPKSKAAKKLTPDEQFFYDNAGSSYTPGKETKEQGMIRGAKALAAAEAWAKNDDYAFIWQDEQEAWSEFTGDMDAEDIANIDSVEWVGMYGPNYDPFGDSGTRPPVQALGGVIFGGDWKQSNNYRRVVEAELALEEFNEKFGKYGVRAGNPEVPTPTREAAIAARLATGCV